MENRTNFEIAVDDDLADAFEQLATSQGVTAGELIEQMIRADLDSAIDSKEA